MRSYRIGSILLSATLLLACGERTSEESTAPRTAFETGVFGWVDEARLRQADENPENWYTNGRDWHGTYHSPLQHINQSNIAELGYAWSYELGTKRGQQATPIVVDGVMYAVGNWGRVYALDAATGGRLWTFTPEVDGQYARYACCDVVQRGLQIWQGKVYAGATDGYLHALDARTGDLIWRADTLPAEARQQNMPYTSSGSPQIAGDVVVIGNGGADLGVRGFVSAFDIDTGEFAWRFYTVPRNPEQGPQEAPYLEQALATWDPAGSWKQYGGGGTVWDGMAYDPELDLLYIGTGNASPYSYKERSPAGGDNLYLASIIAIKPETGTLAWYFQQIPGENWDYTSTQKFILADIELAGRMRQVIMQAPKNGFFYVLDRATGEFLSAKPFVPLNWTKGLDAKGRPIPSPQADYTTGPKLVFPSIAGGHNWQPMSRDPRTGMVYIPTYEEGAVMVDSSDRPIGFVPGQFTLYSIAPDEYDSEEVKANLGPLPPFEELAKNAPAATEWHTTLKAIDPLSGEIVWQDRDRQFMSAGVLTTAGNLVFNGRADGTLRVFAAGTGELLKSIDTGSSIMAAPMSYAVGEKQYVAVMTGYGGGGGFAFPEHSAAYRYGNRNRILVFSLGGGATPKPEPVDHAPIPEPISWSASAAEIEQGRRLYFKHCAACHHFGPGLVPDLRRMTPQMHEIFDAVVLEGLLAPNGMGRFDDLLSAADVRAIQSYVIDQARTAAGEAVDAAQSVGTR